MKKILTVFLSILMVISLAACTKKAEEPKEEEPVIDEPKTSFHLEVDFANGVKESVEMSSDAFDNFIECIKGLGPIIGEVTVENGKIVAVKDKKAENGAKWELYVNDGLYEDDVTKLTVSKDDVIRLVYVPGEEPQVNVELNEDVLGGWQTYEAFEDRMKEKEKKIFEKAMEGIDGVAYVPLRVLASQPVSGMNYAFLAQGITVTAVPSVDYYIVVIYVDTENNEDIKAINMLKVPEIETKEEGSDSLLGSSEPTKRKRSPTRRSRHPLKRQSLSRRTSRSCRCSCWQPSSSKETTTWRCAMANPLRMLPRAIFASSNGTRISRGMSASPTSAISTSPTM